MPGSDGFEKQIMCFRDKLELRARIDALGDDDIAILLTRTYEEGDKQLQITSYGSGQETEFLGLFGYGSVMFHRTYFRDDDA